MNNCMPVVDAMNRRILQLLVNDGRMTHNEIAAKLKRSPSTVRDRIKRMEDDGIILGYFAVVNNERMGISVDAILLANLRQGVSIEELRKLKEVEEVKEVLQITGPRRVMVRLQARDSSSLERVLSNKVLPLGLEDPELRMVMSSANRLPGN
jgi:DNA-binding Lrp family transcriptional regulator